MLAHKQSECRKFTTRQTFWFEIEWGDQNQFVFDKALRVYSAIAGGAFDQSERHFVFEQKPNNIAGVAAMQRNLHPRVLLEEPPEQTGENVLRDCGGRTQGQLSRKFAIVGDELPLGFGSELGQPDRVSKQHRALPRQRDLASAAVEQAHAQLIFERLDLQGDGRLRKEELFGGLAKI